VGCTLLPIVFSPGLTLNDNRRTQAKAMDDLKEKSRLIARGKTVEAAALHVGS
jgi:hypothetical protein